MKFATTLALTGLVAEASAFNFELNECQSFKDKILMVKFFKYSQNQQWKTLVDQSELWIRGNQKAIDSHIFPFQLHKNDQEMTECYKDLEEDKEIYLSLRNNQFANAWASAAQGGYLPPSNKAARDANYQAISQYVQQMEEYFKQLEAFKNTDSFKQEQQQQKEQQEQEEQEKKELDEKAKCSATRDAVLNYDGSKSKMVNGRFRDDGLYQRFRYYQDAIENISPIYKLFDHKGRVLKNLSAIAQGGLGDCWALAGMAAVAENIERVKKIFGTDKFPEDGKFCMNFYDSGKPVQFCMDARLPGRASSHGGFSADRQGNQLRGELFWGSYLEKALAEFYGEYIKLSSGQTGEALWTLTGMPLKKWRNDQISEEQLWEKLLEAEEKNWIITAAVIKRVGRKVLGKEQLQGLVGDHAYTVLGVKELSTGAKLVKIRNPHSTDSWAGDWSDKDQSKKEILKEETGHVSSTSDGIFYMSLQDYQFLFYDTQIAMYQTWEKDMLELKWSREDDDWKGKEFTITSTEDQLASIGFSGAQRRTFDEKKCESPQQLDSFGFKVYKADGTPFKDCEGSKKPNHRGEVGENLESKFGNVFLHCHLKKDTTYKVQISSSNINKANGGEMPVTFLTYGDKGKVEIEKPENVEEESDETEIS